MDKGFSERIDCILCGSENLSEIFSAPSISLTGVFPKVNDADPLKTPLTLKNCNDCNNLQMKEVVNQDLMFNDYWYRSGTTNSMKQHFHFILDLIDDFSSTNSKRDILDIASNDSTFMTIAEERGYSSYGIEPSNAIFDSPYIDQLQNKISKQFFPSSEDWSLGVEKFDVITALSMFYDVEDPQLFIRNLEKRLNPDGLAVIEVNYAKFFIERGNVDMLGHEHLIYYFISTFEGLLQNSTLNLNHAVTNEMNGGNIVFFLSTQNSFSNDLRALKQVEKKFLEQLDYDNFQEDTSLQFKKLKVFLENLSKNHVLKIYGASTRGAFICQYLQLDKKIFKSAVDIQENKIGRRIPGTDIEIEHEDIAEKPDYFLILPYQFLDEFIQKNLPFLKQGGRFLTYRPDFFEIYLNNGEIIKDRILSKSHANN